MITHRKLTRMPGGGVGWCPLPDMEDIFQNFNKVEGKEAESLVQEAIASLSV